jgi:hypothetical protein
MKGSNIQNADLQAGGKQARLKLNFKLGERRCQGDFICDGLR